MCVGWFFSFFFTSDLVELFAFTYIPSKDESECLVCWKYLSFCVLLRVLFCIFCVRPTIDLQDTEIRYEIQMYFIYLLLSVLPNLLLLNVAAAS